MNIFQHLGLSSTHRNSSKVVQLVKNFDEVPDSKKHWPMLAQVKYDGVYGALVVQGGVGKLFGRTGKKFTSCERIESHYGALLSDGIYIGEVVFPGQSLETLSGAVNPNRTKPLTESLALRWHVYGDMIFHDYLSVEEFERGVSSELYLDRFDWLQEKYGNSIPLAESKYVHNLSEAMSFAADCISRGEEGAVFKQDCSWEAGHKGFRSMKMVRAVSYDLLCIGTEEGTGKYAGKVANLVFQWHAGDTLVAMLGKGWTHNDARGMFLAVNGDPGASPGNPVGCIFRVYGLQDSSKGKIRLPKVGEIRHDKSNPDV